MRTRLLLLLLAGAAVASGQYTYDLTGVPTGGATWTANGAVDNDYPSGIDFGEDSGSFIYQPAVSTPGGGSANDYEVSMTFTPSWMGTVVEYLRASSNALRGTGATGSFISVELSPGAMGLAIKQSVSGTVTAIGSTTFSTSLLTTPSTLRSIIWGTTLWVFLNNQLIYSNTGMPSTTGQPGIGGIGPGYPYGICNITSVSIGHHDVVAPGAPLSTGFRSSVWPTSVSLAWQGVTDDSTGSGFFRYKISRGGTALTYVNGTPLLTDSTVAAGTSYTYSVAAVDFHGNVGTATSISVTTPPSSDVDPRRTGIYTTGSYWGGGGEQIDTLSGNLNFSIPLIKPTGRTGWTVPVGLSYNSQNWRQDGSYNWSLGVDNGYGYGWTMQIGSITPYYAGWTSGVDHYVFTDGSGAQYRLDQNNSGIWSSLQGIYVWFDSGNNQLHFRDGRLWVMGCTSYGGEEDAGTMYPTILEDFSGNTVIVTYQAGIGLPSTVTNTSARMVTVEDVRAVNIGTWPTTLYASYSFTYNADPIPHLTAITNHIGSSEKFPTFTYAKNVALGPPFGSSDPVYSGATTTHLTNIIVPAAGPTNASYPAAGQYTFGYDSAGAAELDQVTYPWGGHLRWVYSNATYAGSRLMREVSSRYLAADAAGAVEWGPYPFTHSDTGGIGTVHVDTTLADASGTGAKKWTFTTSGSAWQVGLAAQFIQLSAVGGTVMTRDTYSWSQTSGSTVAPKIGAQPYISQKVHEIDPTGGNAQSATSTQAVDAYGNTTAASVYPYNSTSAALQSFSNTYWSAYASHYLLNRLLTTTVTAGGTTYTPVQNLYDAAGYATQFGPSPFTCSGSMSAGSGSGIREYDPSPPNTTNRGLVTQTTNPAVTHCMQYDSFGGLSAETGSDGSSLTAPADSSVNYAAPTTLTTESYDYSLSYNAWMGMASSTGSNGESVYMTYDTAGRPSQGTSAYGDYTTYAYPGTGVLPTWQSMTNANGYRYTLLDGLGRAAQVKRGPSTGVESFSNSVYTPCACSPTGKLQKTSQPRAPTSGVSWSAFDTATPAAWTVYTYDGIGRTLSVTAPDGTSATTYSYSGNQTTVTDSAGNWKKFTTDVLGNLVTVTEPDPANLPSGTLTTTYAYDWMNHLTTSTMTRGSTTQTRTFVYNAAGQLSSATNPESGTVSYTYGSNNLVATKLDANSLTTTYSYDTSNNLTSVTHSSGGTVDDCQTVAYTYGTNKGLANYNRLLSTTYHHGSGSAGAGCGLQGDWFPSWFTESYVYNAAGDVTAKTFRMYRGWEDLGGHQASGELSVSYGYGAFGRATYMTYKGYDPYAPVHYDGLGYPANNMVFLYGYDSQGRPTTMTEAPVTGDTPVSWVQGVNRDIAGRITQIQYPQNSATFGYMTEAKTYNTNGGLASMSWTPAGSGTGLPSGSLGYTYTATGHTGDNGEVMTVTDGVSGETINYQYDALKRLTSAAATPTTGSTPTAWTQSFGYDGFGNLTGKTLGGTTTAIPVDPVKNQLQNQTGVLSGVSYDANGNLLSVTSAGASALTMTYDRTNRLATSRVGTGGTDQYLYDPANHRIYRWLASGDEEWTLYGARGENLGTFTWDEHCDDPDDPDDCWWRPVAVRTNIWFGGKLIWTGTSAGTSGPAFTDRGGTNRASGARFRPYGDEITSTGNDREKFATYKRDASTGLDYADQRYYASSYGRFNTADPYQASAGPSDPASWNRYAYVGGDPINRKDPRGLLWVEESCGTDGPGGECSADGGYGGGGGTLPGGGEAPCIVFDNSGACAAGDNGGGELPGGGGGGPSNISVFGQNGAASALAKPKCAQLFGFNSTAAAQAAFAQLTFVQGDLGQMKVVTTPAGIAAVAGSPAPAQTVGNTVTVNTDVNFFDLSNVTAVDINTKTNVSYDFLGAENQFLGTNMTSAQFASLIILHEFKHSALGGNAPQESSAGAFSYNSSIFKDCLQ